MLFCFVHIVTDGSMEGRTYYWPFWSLEVLCGPNKLTGHNVTMQYSATINLRHNLFSGHYKFSTLLLFGFWAIFSHIEPYLSNFVLSWVQLKEGRTYIKWPAQCIKVLYRPNFCNRGLVLADLLPPLIGQIPHFTLLLPIPIVKTRRKDAFYEWVRVYLAIIQTGKSVIVHIFFVVAF